MKKTISIYIGFLLLIFNTFAQNQNSIPYVDSLKNVAVEVENLYSKIDAYSQICWIQRSRNPIEAIEYGNQALKLINEHSGYDTLRPEILNYLGVVHRNKGDYNAALTYYMEALEAAEKYENKKQIAYSNNNLGGLFTLKGNYANAIEYMEKALFYFDLLEDKRGMGYVTVNLGNLYRHNGDYSEAVDYFKRALGYKEQVNDTIGVAIVLNLQAISLYENKELNKAAKLYAKLQILYKHNQDYKGLAVVNNYLGKIEIANKNYTQAIELFNDSYTYNQQVDYKQGQSENLINIGLAYHYLGEDDKALNYMRKGYDLAKQIGDSEGLINVFQHYAIIYKDQQKYDKALEYQEFYTEELQRKFESRAREKLASLRINNELDKSNKINEVLSKQNSELVSEIEKDNNTLWIYRISILILAIILLLFTYRMAVLYKRNKNKLQDNTELIKANKDLQQANQLRDRFLSIIGHDLKNPFNSVLGLTSLLVDEWDGIPETEKKYIINEIHGTGNTLYELMDNLLLWAKNQNQALSLYKEPFDINETIVDVYELFRNQASFKDIKLELEIGEKNMVQADVNMINTVIRNLVSNAIKFTRKGGKVKIELKRTNNELEFNISDHGKGILPEDLKRILDDKTTHTTKGTANETGTGLGLLLVKDFVQQNKGIFWVDSKPGVGSRFCFTIPLA